MRRHWIVGASTLIGIAAVVATGAGAAGFGTQTQRRSFARIARSRWARPAGVAASLARLRGVNFVSGCGSATATTTTRSSSRAQPGLSHDHTFLGNVDDERVLDPRHARGRTSSCRRPGDTAAYWVPTLIAASGQAIVPRAATVYYRRHTLAPVTAFPQGFKLIAGNSKATSRPGSDASPPGTAGRSRRSGRRPRSRPAPTPTVRGSRCTSQFPDCWDGVNLDSADHQSHMAYSVRGGCPADHPVAVPALQVNVRYPSAGGAGLALASGGQFSGHADFFNAWNQAALQRLVNGCLNALRHCGQRF